ncbi:MAG: DUF1570 domain-containing protein [Planctomycetaceae bacterium]
MFRATRRCAQFLLVAICLLPTLSLFGDERPNGTADSASRPLAFERVTFRRGQAETTVEGRVLVEAADGGLLVESADGRLWTIEPDQKPSRAKIDGPFSPLTPEALGRQLQAEVGGDSEIVVTLHYVICTRAGRPYAQWCGALFERLYAAFHNYWKQRGLELREPEFPLPAIVLADAKQFAAFATRDEGPELADAKGYYSIRSNRMVLYDLTAADGRARSEADISRRLAAAPFNIATVVHEATHQIAFNSGLHTRYADNPLWLTEGMAMYFETPDLASRSGWKTVGAVNDPRLRQFREYVSRRRPANSLETLLAADARFTAADQMADAYGEAWALSYFLIRTRKDDYARYLRALAAKPRMIWDQPAERLAQFRECFGADLRALDAEFLKHTRRLR